MAWTAVMTAVANSAFTASQFNIHVRDNLNETAPAKATTAGRIFVSTGANAIAERQIEGNTVATQQTTTSTSYTDLSTAGPTVTVTTGTKAVVLWKARLWTDTANTSALMSVAVSGDTSISASDTIPLVNSMVGTNGLAAAMAQLNFFTTLTAGSNTFTCKYRVQGSATATYIDRQMLVVAL